MKKIITLFSIICIASIGYSQTCYPSGYIQQYYPNVYYPQNQSQLQVNQQYTQTCGKPGAIRGTFHFIGSVIGTVSNAIGEVTYSLGDAVNDCDISTTRVCTTNSALAVSQNQLQSCYNQPIGCQCNNYIPYTLCAPSAGAPSSPICGNIYPIPYQNVCMEPAVFCPQVLQNRLYYIFGGIFGSYLSCVNVTNMKYVSGSYKADINVIINDPLRGQWVFYASNSASMPNALMNLLRDDIIRQYQSQLTKNNN